MARHKATHTLDFLPPPPAGRGYQEYPTAHLLLDDDNPRLIEYYENPERKPTQLDLLKILFERMAVEEVAMSIAYNGYFKHEPLVLETTSRASFIAIEGNRRLAAVMLLLSSDLREKVGATDLPDIDLIDADRRMELQNLPGILSTRKDAWRYLGFKHVNGTSTWGAYAKAQYIARVHNEYGVSLPDIARQIGDYSNMVERQYRGLMVIEQAEEEGLFDRTNTSKGKFPFNYIYTALDSENFRDYLGISNKNRDSRRPIPRSKHKNLGELMLWLYGDRANGVPSVIKSQNPDLTTLGATISDPRGVSALRDGLPLSVAREISKGDLQIFKTALYDTKSALQKCHATLTTGYDTTDRDAKAIAIDIEQLARDLVDQMELKQRKGLRPSR